MNGGAFNFFHHTTTIKYLFEKGLSPMIKNPKLWFLVGVVLLLGAVVIWQPVVAQDDEDDDEGIGAAAYAVDLIGAWVEGGAPNGEFDYVGQDGNTYQGTFDVDILPLFTQSSIWGPNTMACTSCHYANSEESYHEMNLSSYEGIRAGVDVLEDPPGGSLLGESSPGAGDFDWENSELRHRLRDNRMPAHAPFIIDESNRDGPLLDVNGTEIYAVDLIGAWVDAGAPEEDAFGDYGATFADNVVPLFTTPNLWFEGAQACAECHFANTPESYHEMSLVTYEGIRSGSDVLEDPPGESILGESEVMAGDFDWENSELKHRLRDNRMPPGANFLLDESNRDGPLVLHGVAIDNEVELDEPFSEGECEVRAVNLIGAWVEGGAPNGTFEFTAEDGSTCDGDFTVDVLPLFTQINAWGQGSPACTSCHYANSEESYHEMNLSSYEGIRAGVDVLEDPPGGSLLGESSPGAGDFDWENSELRHRLRDNRMPAHAPFIIDESNRDGPLLDVNGTEIYAVDLIGAWVDAGAPEADNFGDYGATFADNVLPLFTTPDLWFDGAQACAECHFANTPESYHEMSLVTYEGIRSGSDVLEDPPGESILGESEVMAGDFNWDESELRHRLRDNRMPPGSVFLLDESNRDGPLMMAGTKK